MAIPILNHMDFQKSAEIRNVRLHNTADSGVTSPGTGQIIYDSGTVKFYNGSAWVSVGTGSGSGGTGFGGLEFHTNSGGGAGYGTKICASDAVQTFARRNNSATWTESMRIASGGQLLVGTTTQRTFFDVQGTTTSDVMTVLHGSTANANVGMIIFRDPEYAEKARILRDHGMSKEKRYWHTKVGHNYRLTNLQAAIGVAQMEKIQYIIDKKSRYHGH